MSENLTPHDSPASGRPPNAPAIVVRIRGHVAWLEPALREELQAAIGWTTIAGDPRTAN